MEDNFEIESSNRSITLKKDDIAISIDQSLDDDIWFNSNGNVSLTLNYSLRVEEEWRCYTTFANLMKSIIGRFILNGDDKDEYSILPQDFIDLENKTITWHSDTGADNILQLQYSQKAITITMTKDNDRTYDGAIKVRIRTNGSSYEYYYQEFMRFFSELSRYATKVNGMGRKLNK